MNQIKEAFKLKDKVKIVSSIKDVTGKIGYIGEISSSVGGRKTYTIDYDYNEKTGNSKSIQLQANNIRIVKESKLTFKKFLSEEIVFEEPVAALASKAAARLLGFNVQKAYDVEKFIKQTHIDDYKLMRAKEIAHKYIDTAAGRPWIVRLFSDVKGNFARIEPAKGEKEGNTYFISKDKMPKNLTKDLK